MKLLYSILCSDILTDRETGSTTYIKTIDQIITPGIPILIPSLSIATCWLLENDLEKEYDVKIEIVSPSGEKKPPIPVFTIKAEREGQKHRVNIRLNPFPIDQSGNYTVHIEWKYHNKESWKKEDEIILPIILKKPEKGIIH